MYKILQLDVWKLISLAENGYYPEVRYKYEPAWQ